MVFGTTVSQENVIVPYPKHRPGFFSVFLAVISALQAYEKGLFAGVSVNLQDGYYLDLARGNNWWDYYFEPIAIGNTSNSQARILSGNEIGAFSNNSFYHMSRQEGYRIINKYIRVKPDIQKKVDGFVHKYLKDFFCDWYSLSRHR